MAEASSANKVKNYDDIVKIMNIVREGAEVLDTVEYSIYLACLFHVNYGYKIEYGIIKINHEGTWHSRAHVWSEASDGSIVDISMVMPTSLINHHGKPVFFIKPAIIFGNRVEFKEFSTEIKKDARASYSYISGIPRYFPQPEAINFAIQSGEVQETDFEDIANIMKEEGISKTKLKEYLRSKHIMLSNMIKKQLKSKINI